MTRPPILLDTVHHVWDKVAWLEDLVSNTHKVTYTILPYDVPTLLGR